MCICVTDAGIVHVCACTHAWCQGCAGVSLSIGARVHTCERRNPSIGPIIKALSAAAAIALGVAGTPRLIAIVRMVRRDAAGHEALFAGTVAAARGQHM